MKDATQSDLKILVGIASYGSTNDEYLVRLFEEYRAMRHSVDIVVFSNVPRDLGSDIEVVAGLPTSDPWSLPFAHKQLFAARSDDYDLFIYSEDDTLITQHNINAFLNACTVLREDEVPGFLRFEVSPTGDVSYPDAHHDYHWDVESIRRRAGQYFAFFTNEHSACYVLTREQLKRAIRSGQFQVPPHQGKYDLACTAATDPYTQCGLTKLICLSHISDFLVHHLSNKYIGRLGLPADQFDRQIRSLLDAGEQRLVPASLVKRHPKFKNSQFGKNYYEPVREDFIALIPSGVQNVLSLGCGWGATERRLSDDGKTVVAIPLDPVIAACAGNNGITLVGGDVESALNRLDGQIFDCVLISNLLHLVEDPKAILARVAALMSKEAILIVAVPNLARISVLWRRFKGTESHKLLGVYDESGVHFTSRTTIRRWLRQAGLKVDRFADVLPERALAVCRATGGLAIPLLASELVAVGTRQ
jgi:2-polyprenyl-3-methyl-5-hydroxy-6-metoxy-1,4-benzoquinol methylase